MAYIDLDATRTYLEERWPRDDWQTWTREVVERHARRLKGPPTYLEDLLLAWACIDGVNEAAAELDRSCLTPLVPAVKILGVGDADVEELLARGRMRLLVGDVDRDAGLLSYAGRGPLAGFVRSTILRLAIDEKRRRPRSTSDDLAELADLVVTDPAIKMMRDQYGKLVADALRVAWNALSRDDRLLLGYQVFDGLTVDEIGRVLNVHRSTASRRCVAAREHLLVRVRHELGKQLDASPDTVDSIVRAVVTGLTGRGLFGRATPPRSPTE